MIKKKLKRITAIALTAISLGVLNPETANAEWRLNLTGWWYKEGDSWATGWRLIDEKWYYFSADGYMKTGWIYDGDQWYYSYSDGSIVQNAWNDQGYYLDSSGAWTDTAEHVRSSIFNNGKIYGTSGNLYYQAGDPHNLDVINDEPCIIIEDEDGTFYFAGLNTLSVYDINSCQFKDTLELS